MCNSKGVVRQYTTLYQSSHKQLHISAVQEGHQQAVCFRKVKEESYLAIVLLLDE
jgi:hypothetical protein